MMTGRLDALSRRIYFMNRCHTLKADPDMHARGLR